jgi:hypothetical protein
MVATFVLLSACSGAPDAASQPWSDTDPRVSAAQSSAVQSPSETAPVDDIAVDLAKVPGVLEATELASTIPDTRFFFLRFKQPVDHKTRDAAKFSQRLTLIYRSREAPMVLATTGYDIPVSRPYQTEPTFLLGANQLLLEHRFFAESTPAPVDWTKLDIFQAAEDQHRIVQAFQPIFAKKWLTTGGSKGGMTAIYHRFFHPNDVAATVPYVAPTSFGRFDPRYIAFVQKVGTADCRAKLQGFQEEVLTRRAEMEPLMVADAAQYQLSFDRTGIHWALDYTVNEAPFTFWQYGLEEDCAQIPARTATSADLFAFLQFIYFGSVANGFADEVLDFYAPYYYQSATELGGPGYAMRHLQGLLSPGFRDLPQDLPPLGVEKPFRFASMPIVSLWLRAAADRMLFVYGANDPWSSGAATVRSENDSYRYDVVGGNHGSGISDLPEAQQNEARAHLARWMGVPIAVPQAAARALGTGAERPFESLALWRRHSAEHAKMR